MLVGYYIIKYYYEVIVNKKAFSLFELILVIILIGLVYSLVLEKLDKKENLKIQRLKDLKNKLEKYKSPQVNLVVFNHCNEALINNKKIDLDTKLFQKTTVYEVKDNDLVKKEFDPIVIKDRTYDVCFRFDIYKNGSSSAIIVKKENKFTVFPPYFKNPFVVDNEDEAKDALTNKKLLEEFNHEI